MGPWLLLVVAGHRAGVRSPAGPATTHEDALYYDVDAVAEDIEEHHSGVPIGAEDDASLDLLQRLTLPPDVFEHCVLVRDYAEPFRVGSAMALRGKSRLHRHTVNSTVGAIEIATDEGDIPVEDLKLADGVAGQGVHESNAVINVPVYANLQSVTGEVQVVGHGMVEKWTSKRRVPIAGYLCTVPESAPVLHSLPTPCVMTTIDDDGAALQPENKTADVWVGGTKFSFKSIREAHDACFALAKTIAEDRTFSSYGAEDVLPARQNFLQASTRTKNTAWTTGKKTLVVAVMDWMWGDDSVAPYSKQVSDDIKKYRDEIFPRVVAAFREMSHGYFDLEVTIIPDVVRYTRKRSNYVASGYPFPALYNAAETAVEGSALRLQYSFSKYDLAYVIAPQQRPTGTKGVAWVGAKGSMCNGCEAISDNFKVMVAVHELGHNLGLSHASSRDLAYGNPFDWMGNYPDVVGLTYGVGYQYALGWLREAQVFKVQDSSLGALSHRVILRPFDRTEADGVVGVRISLSSNARDVYVSYRGSLADVHAGVFLVSQDKTSPKSELIDAACHSPTQQDARLRSGWTYLDPTGQVAIVVEGVKDDSAVLHVYAVTKEMAGNLRAREKFTDGVWKCPRTCSNSDLLVANFGDCLDLAQQGYCTGTITMMNQKFSIGSALCPVACDKCAEVMSGTPLKDGGCKDLEVKINGMKCWKIAREGYCDATTNIGSVGYDLCPESCGNCPARPVETTGSPVADPAVIATIGGANNAADEPAEEPSEEASKGAAGKSTANATTSTTLPPTDEDASANTSTTTTTTEAEEEPEEAECVDDAEYSDVDGDSCAAYEKYLSHNPDLDPKEVCSYGDGGAKLYCRKTCGTCIPTRRTCVDHTCVQQWLDAYGRCYQCADWGGVYCDEEYFRADCPLTCGVCKPMDTTTTTTSRTTTTTQTTTTTTTTTTTSTTLAVCEDHECIDHWLKDTGKCLHCGDYTEYCGDDEEFDKSCQKTCALCTPKEVPLCADSLELSTCSRYLAWDWCAFPNVAERCKETCGICSAQAAALEAERNKGVLQRAAESIGIDKIEILHSLAPALALAVLYLRV